MKPLRLVILLLIACLFSFPVGQAQPEMQHDELLRILQKEVSISMDSLSTRAFPIREVSYNIADDEFYYISVVDGSLEKNIHSRQRSAETRMTVGQSEWTGDCLLSSSIPLSNDATSIHRILSAQSRDAYDRAVYKSRVNTTLKKNNGKSFDEFQESSYEPPLTNTAFSQQQLIDKLKKCTRLMEEVPQVLNCRAVVYYKVNRNHWVSNLVYRVNNYVNTNFSLTITMVSDDGEVLMKEKDFHFENPDDILEEEQLKKELWDLYSEEKSYFEKMNAVDSLVYNDWWREALTDTVDEHFSMTEVMREMIRLAQDSLKIGDEATPYDVIYEITDAHKASIKASMGLSISENENDYRFLVTDVGVGSDVRNQHNFVGAMSSDDRSHFVPLDNHRGNLYKLLWRSAASSYSDAVRTFQLKEDKVVTLKEKGVTVLPDRSMAITKSVDNTRPLQQECLPQMQNFACEFSQILGEKHPLTSVDIEYYQANFHYADAQGLQYVQPITFLEIMVIDNDAVVKKLYFKDINELEQHHDSLVTVMKQLCVFLDERAQAPSMDEIYYGPVLFVEDAAAQLFANTFFTGRESLIAYRKPLDDYYNEKLIGQGTPLSRLIEQRIVHPGISITATDRVQEYNGLPLVGSYEVDAEGVEVEKKVELVNRGELVTLLSNRTPTEKIAYSNGHQRFAVFQNRIEPCCGPGVVEMSCKTKMNRTKLMKRLRDAARAAGYDHAYIITTLANNKDVQTAYRVDVHNGKMTLVRDVRIKPVTYRDFRQMTAADDTKKAFNLMVNPPEEDLFEMPCSVIVPSGLLLESIELDVQY
ncbi:MAG: hypothetical protein K6A41_06660 [Bacteroidales bacterium]|nr:hypothetical protein [Bacteroidales bacterium]